MRATMSASTRTDGVAVPEVELPRAVQQRNTLFKRQKLNDDDEPRVTRSHTAASTLA